MIKKEQLLSSIIQECEICKKLFAKIPAEYDYNYRPADNMRSTAELLQYLTFAPYEFAAAMVCNTFRTNDWKHYTDAESESLSLKPENFPEAMDRQIEKFKNMFNGFNDEELINKDTASGWSTNVTLGAALIDSSLKVATAYRMQLFLYLKMSCTSELHSGDCWG